MDTASGNESATNINFSTLYELRNPKYNPLNYFYFSGKTNENGFYVNKNYIANCSGKYIYDSIIRLNSSDNYDNNISLFYDNNGNDSTNYTNLNIPFTSSLIKIHSSQAINSIVINEKTISNSQQRAANYEFKDDNQTLYYYENSPNSWTNISNINISNTNDNVFLEVWL